MPTVALTTKVQTLPTVFGGADTKTQLKPLEQRVEKAASKAKKGLGTAGKIVAGIGTALGVASKVVALAAPASGPAAPILAGIAGVASVVAIGINVLASIF